ncbi:hypothetical protein FIBSPDRAFT_926588 [Athelia psychrophila]|uniref:eIF2D winged helix domain-containing protein n=1 Tax=Athelia psychrophila TaxID=1759441 RepID=A0A166T0Z5_9AGAM|nr:hypothetical protein FIBSPDRAFT_926588 [Fibularhizoctonia sp. CBS 109695]
MVLSGGEAPAWGEREGWEGKKGCPGEGLPVGDGCRRGGVGVAKCPQGNGAAAGGRSMPMVGMGKGRKKWPMRWDSSRRCRLKVTTTLRAMLLYSIATNCLNAWPITATIFYTTHILPFRPASPPSAPSGAPTPIDIKNSLHKSPTTFLKAAEKGGLVKLKELKAGKGPELVLMGVFHKHIDVEAHPRYATLKYVEDTRAKEDAAGGGWSAKRRREGAWLGARRGRWLEASLCASARYAMPELKTFIHGYIAAHALVNPNDQSGKEQHGGARVLKRDDMTWRVVDKMQAWHEIAIDGGKSISKKDALKPISVVAKIRQGKVSTLISGFEPFLMTVDVLAEALRWLYASVTGAGQGGGDGGARAGQAARCGGGPAGGKEVVDLSSKMK